MDMARKYGLGETVAVGRGSPEELGIIESITIKEQVKIDKGGENHSRKVKYDVRTDWVGAITYGESALHPSSRQLHKDAFRVQKGQVIKREDKEYVVEDARKICSTRGSEMGRSTTWKWHVEARELADGKYNPSAKPIGFIQENAEPIDIVREMNVGTTSK